MQQRISEALTQIEHNEAVHVLYACESGSRAWGFPSKNSDYDVRFLYIRPPEWYLSINLEHKRDVIERPIVDQLDINGWDLRKALKLLCKSNPPLLEWLQSPTVYWDAFGIAKYWDAFGIANQLRGLLPAFYSPIACHYHYLHMARGNFRDYLKDHEVVWVKKYFYVLRPLLAVCWIDAGYGLVPIAFQTMVDVVVKDAQVRHAIEELVARKRAGDELGQEPRVPVLSDFIAQEMERLEGAMVEQKRSRTELEPLNVLFRETLHRVWAGDAEGEKKNDCT